MDALKNMILTNGKVIGHDILKVDSFLNHQIDANLMNEIGKEFKKIFGDEKITKVLTIEASGIAIGVMAAFHFGVPLVFAKKTVSRNLDADCYCTEVKSFTKQAIYSVRISKKYLNSNDNVLIVDDFLANGNALLGLCDLVKQSGAKLSGAGIVIEKGFQGGGDKLRQNGIRIESLAIIDSMNENKIEFR